MKPREPNLATWLIIILIIAGCVLILAALIGKAFSKEPSPGIAYCALYAREATRIDLMHTIPVKPTEVTDKYIELLAVQVFKDCVSVLPTLLPLPEQHRNLGSWIMDMRYLITQRVGTVPAAGPVASDDTWRAQCEATYRTWDPDTGTVIRKGAHERTRCPCGDEVICE